MGTFDNFNEEQPKIFITHGKSATMHIGTVFYLKKNRPLELPLGTKMTSPMGVKITVTECLSFNADKYLVPGAVVGWYVATAESFGAVSTQQDLIREGFLHPEIRWDVKVAGLSSVVKCTYILSTSRTATTRSMGSERCLSWRNSSVMTESSQHQGRTKQKCCLPSSTRTCSAIPDAWWMCVAMFIDWLLRGDVERRDVRSHHNSS